MQIIKPRCRVYAANNPYSKNGYYYVVSGLGHSVGCACIDTALATWYETIRAMWLYRELHL